MLARKLGMLDTDSSDLCKSSLIASAFSESIRYNVPCLLLSFTLCIRHLTFLISHYPRAFISTCKAWYICHNMKVS